MSVAFPWCDSFELTTLAAILDRYVSGTASGPSSTGTTRTNQYLVDPTNLKQTFTTNSARIITGAGWYLTSNNFILVSIYDGATVQAYVQINGDNTLSVYRGGGVLLWTSDPVTQVFTTVPFFPYLEFDVTVHDSAGSFDLYVNESRWAHVTGVNTRNSANNYANGVGIGSAGGNKRVDDFYVDNGSIGVWGNQKIEMLRPFGPGTYSQFSRGGLDLGSNYREVQDQAQDGDATYVEYATAGGKDSYALYDMAGTPSQIRYLQGTMYAKKQDVIDKQNQFLLIVGGSEYLTCSEVLSTSYAFYKCGWQTDPATGLPFGYAGARGINNLELGSRILV